MTDDDTTTPHISEAIDEVRIYDRPLEVLEIKAGIALHKGEFPDRCPSCKPRNVWWGTTATFVDDTLVGGSAEPWPDLQEKLSKMGDA